jgi:hypothetical protein
MIGKFVVVTTSHRGVFFGQLESRDGDELTLLDAQNCIYWSTDEKGFLGLAAKGPGPRCRIGPVVPRLNVNAVTAVVEATENSIELWRSEPWSK